MRKLIQLLCSTSLCLSVTMGMADESGTESMAGLVVSFDILDASGHTAARFTPGEVATFRIALTNTTATEIRTTYTAPGYEIAVYEPGSRILLWQANADVAFAQVVQDYVIPPGETKRLETAWDLRDADGRPLPPGQYDVRATLNIGQRGELNALSLTIK